MGDLVRDAPIASVSFGCAREFRILRKGHTDDSALDVDLRDGSFLLMGGEMQKHYLHGIPMGGEKGQKGVRINLTFRICHPRRNAAPAVGSGPPPGAGLGVKGKNSKGAGKGNPFAGAAQGAPRDNGYYAARCSEGPIPTQRWL